MSGIDPPKKKRFIKPATDPDKCLEMAEKYGWEPQEANDDYIIRKVFYAEDCC